MAEDLQNITWPGWETMKLIGRGSFGAVYEIQRDVFGDVEKAALKVISIPQNDSDIDEMYSDGYDDESITNTFKSHLKSIVAEYSLMRKMNGCANIVNCDDIRYVQHDDGIGWDIFIKMELLSPLTKSLPDQIDEETVIKIAKDMCTALELCKIHGIVHRDIKPQNIFVSPYGDYKLGDFGIAKTVEKTMGGTKIGTYKYMAPEVYNNQPYGAAADIYSLGLVLYWLLNERRMPFMPLPPEKLKAGTEELARNRRLSGEPLPPPAHGSDKLKQIVLKACAYDQKDRYHSANEMLHDLNAMTDKESPTNEENAPAPSIPEEPETAAAPAMPAVETASAPIIAETFNDHTAEASSNSLADTDSTPVRSTADAEPSAADDSAQPTPKPAKKRKKTWLFSAIASVALLGILIACFAGGIFGGIGDDSWKNNVMSNYGWTADGDVFGSFSVDKSDIRTITFMNTTEHANQTAWDVSAAGDGSVLAWVEDNEDLYIGANGGVCAPEDCSTLFCQYTNVTSIDFNNNFHTNYVMDMNSMFAECSSLTELDLRNFDTSSAENMSGMFWGCSSLTNLNLRNFDTSSVTNMWEMFEGCSSLKKLDLSHFDTSSVTDMSWMFEECSSLTELNLRNFDTSSVYNMSGMFQGCSSLKKLDLSHFDTSSVEYMNFMFSGCGSLTSLNLSGFDVSLVERHESFVEGVPAAAIIGNPWA